jgi:hypothetical protein
MPDPVITAEEEKEIQGQIKTAGQAMPIAARPVSAPRKFEQHADATMKKLNAEVADKQKLLHALESKLHVAQATKK